MVISLTYTTYSCLYASTYFVSAVPHKHGVDIFMCKVTFCDSNCRCSYKTMDSQLKLVCLLLLIHALVYPYKCSSQPVPTVTASVYPDNSEVHREADTVILICQATGLNSSLHVVAWVKYKPSSVIIANSRNTFVSHERYRVSFNETGLVILNLTISPVETSDSGTYKCTLYEEELGSTSSTAVTHDLLVMSVYHRDAFPFCNATGPTNVTIGRQLLCRTTGNATPVIEGDNVEWSYFTLDQEALLAKNVTSCDNNQTYMCVAEIEGSPTSLSCNIGPLTVIKVNDQSTSVTTTPVLETTTPVLETTTPALGLSETEISAVIIGVIAFLVIAVIAVLIMCFRCNPRRLLHAKPYPSEHGSSFGTTHAQQDDSASDPSDVAIRSEPRGEPPSYISSVLHTEDASLPDDGERRRFQLKGESNVYAESPMCSKKEDMTIALHLDLNIVVCAGNRNGQHPSNKEPIVVIPDKDIGAPAIPAQTPAIYTRVIKRQENDTYISNGEQNPPDEEPSVRNIIQSQEGSNWKGDSSAPSGTSGNPAQTPDIYAQVNKRRGNNAPDGMVQTRKPKIERKPNKYDDEDEGGEAGASQTFVYEDLETLNNEIIQLDEQHSIYADIQI